MQENHKNEQYFFNEKSQKELTGFLGNFNSICCLCTPSLGTHLESAKNNFTILDIDKRFENSKYFKFYDINKPRWLDHTFEVIICDPPFFNISLSTLFKAIRQLSHNNFEQKVMISYLSRRSNNIVNTFSKFNLNQSGYFPTYKTVQNCEKNDIEFFSNFKVNINQKD
ncbi:MAG: hypothetical protein COA79_22620 [Planctomycetota bacterium]|nr:MAG: hypothetical protein COA79_22620 [Planctomycetota bacterium]